MRRFLQLHFGCLMLLLLAVSHDGAAQGRRISTFPYNQSFGFVTAGVTQFPTTDVDGGEFVADDSTATTWTTTLSSAGLYNAGGKLRIQTVKAKQQQGFVWYGDFSNANVMNSSEGVRIIDWEFAGPGIWGTDEIRLWSNLEYLQDREHLMTQFIDDLPVERRRDTGVLMHWLALRQLAENLAAPRRYQNPENIALGHMTLAEARAWRARLSREPAR